MNNEDKKERFTLWMKHSTFEKVEENYRKDNCQKKSEFIENAVYFYCGYLKMNSSETFLSPVLKNIIYGLVREGGRAKEFETAIMWLCDCGLVH